MEWTGKCPDCYAELVYSQTRTTILWTCPNCKWGLATTNPSLFDKRVFDKETIPVNIDKK